MATKKKKVEDVENDIPVKVESVKNDIPVKVGAVGPTIGDVECIESIRSLMKSVSKASVPTLVEFDRASGRTGNVLLDIPSNVVRDGFRIYTAQHPEATSEEYIAVLERLAEMDLPRIFKTVNRVVL